MYYYIIIYSIEYTIYNIKMCFLNIMYTFIMQSLYVNNKLGIYIRGINNMYV